MLTLFVGERVLLIVGVTDPVADSDVLGVKDLVVDFVVAAASCTWRGFSSRSSSTDDDLTEKSDAAAVFLPVQPHTAREN